MWANLDNQKKFKLLRLLLRFFSWDWFFGFLAGSIFTYYQFIHVLELPAVKIIFDSCAAFVNRG